MKGEIKKQICELTQIHKGLTDVSHQKRKTIIRGPLSFEASFVEGFPVISDCFDIELIVLTAYPKILPAAREIGGRIDRNYEHLYQDGTLCLATPIEGRLLFLEQKSLLGFVNRLVVPYLYGYCYWKKYGQHPFGERIHGIEGIVQYYREELRLGNNLNILAMLAFLFEFGYRGHLTCPCGGGLKVRECHSETLLKLHKYHSKHTLENDFLCLLSLCLGKKEQFPGELSKQIERIRKKKFKTFKTKEKPNLPLIRGGYPDFSQKIAL